MEDSITYSGPQKEVIYRATAFNGLNEEDFSPIPVVLYDLILTKWSLLTNLISKYFDIL